MGAPAIVGLLGDPEWQSRIIQQRLAIDAEAAGTGLVAGVESGVVQFDAHLMTVDIHLRRLGMTAGKQGDACQARR